MPAAEVVSRPPVRLTPAEVRGVRQIANHGDGQPVTVARSGTDLVDAEVAEPILEQHLLFVGPDGTVYRLGSEFELAARRAEVYRTNLLPMGEAELDPLPDPPRDFPQTVAVLHLELRALAEAQDPAGVGAKLAMHGEGFVPIGAQGRREMRALLAELDRRENLAQATTGKDPQ